MARQIAQPTVGPDIGQVRSMLESRKPVVSEKTLETVHGFVHDLVHAEHADNEARKKGETPTNVSRAIDRIELACKLDKELKAEWADARRHMVESYTEMRNQDVLTGGEPKRKESKSLVKAEKLGNLIENMKKVDA